MKTTLRIFVTFLALVNAVCVLAQTGNLDLKVEARMDYQREYVGRQLVGENTGFKGKYVNVQISGNISEDFSYSYRQRMIKPNTNASFWDSTDWMWIKYKYNKNWEIGAGKEVVFIGGYEYDRAPIDLYICSEFWNNIPCYSMAVHAGYTFDGGNDQILAQFCQSPFSYVADDMYAYNLIWYGNHGWWNTIWSVNYIEYLEWKYITYIALGNQFKVGDFRVQLDWMSRAASSEEYFKDMSTMCEVAYSPAPKYNLYLKGTYDLNKTKRRADRLVRSGTDIVRLGGGLEIFPLENDEVRLHGCCSYTFGKNSNPDGVLQHKQPFVEVGVTWRIRPLKVLCKENVRPKYLK